MTPVSPARPRSAAFLILAGFTAWAFAFVLLYALLSFGCAYGWDGVAFGPVSLNRAILVAAWLGCLAALGFVAFVTVRLFRPGEGAGAFLRSAGLALSALALATTAANFFMVATLSTCL